LSSFDGGWHVIFDIKLKRIQSTIGMILSLRLVCQIFVVLAAGIHHCAYRRFLSPIIANGEGWTASNAIRGRRWTDTMTKAIQSAKTEKNGEKG
jgi:hypothetical protein